MQHLEEGMIHAWLDGALSAEESARVEQHTKQCAECAAMVADARGLIAGASRIVSALDVVPGGVIPKQGTNVRAGRSVWQSLHLTPFRAALAASLMVAVASMFSVRGDKSKVERIVLTEASPVVVAPAPAPIAEPPATPAARDAATRTRGTESRAAAREHQKERTTASQTVADSARRVIEAPKVAEKAMDAALPAPAPVVPTAPVAAQMQSPRAASVVEANRVGSADSVAAKNSAFGLQRRAAREPMQLAAGVSTANFGARRFEGCYRVMTDSTNWPRPLPTRFALTQAAATADARERNVVRLIDAAGRPDTTVAGTWHVVADTLANVTWTGGGARWAFAINQGTSVTTAQALTGTITRTVRVAHASCPR